MAQSVEAEKLHQLAEARRRHEQLLFGVAGPRDAVIPTSRIRSVAQGGEGEPSLASSETGNPDSLSSLGISPLLIGVSPERQRKLAKEHKQRAADLRIVESAMEQVVANALTELKIREDSTTPGVRLRRTNQTQLLRHTGERPLQLLINDDGVHLGWERMPGEGVQLGRLRDELARLKLPEVFASIPHDIAPLQDLIGIVHSVENAEELQSVFQTRPLLGNLIPPVWNRTPPVNASHQIQRIGDLARERLTRVNSRDKQAEMIVTQLLWLKPDVLSLVWPHLSNTIESGVLLRAMVQVGRALLLTEQWVPLTGLIQLLAWGANEHSSYSIRRACLVQMDTLLGHHALRATGNQLTPDLARLARTAKAGRAQEHWLAFLLGRISVSDNAEERMRIMPSLRALAAESPTLEHMLLDTRWFIVRNAIDIAAHSGARRYWPLIRAARQHEDLRVQEMAEHVIQLGLVPHDPSVVMAESKATDFISV